jgi:hypothetical protein
MNKKIMSMVIISMMMVVAFGVVFADKGGCPCNEDNEGCVPAPIEDVENTEGNVQPMNTCMRSWIEYRNCGTKKHPGAWTVYECKCESAGGFLVFCDSKCKRKLFVECDKYRVWYNNCTHQMMWSEYLGKAWKFVGYEYGGGVEGYPWRCKCKKNPWEN